MSSAPPPPPTAMAAMLLPFLPSEKRICLRDVDAVRTGKWRMDFTETVCVCVCVFVMVIGGSGEVRARKRVNRKNQAKPHLAVSSASKAPCF
jgi:hypothetical protein